MEPIRAAGYNERRCIIRDFLGLYGYIAVTATYVGPTILDKSTLYQALKLCIDQHPMLSTVIQSAESKSPQLARAYSVDLEKHVRYLELTDDDSSNNSSLRNRLLDIHNEPPTEYESIPQWRVWIFPQQGGTSSLKTTFQMAFACSHALADGMSLFAFHRSFLRALSEINDAKGTPSAVVEVKKEKALLPALDRVVKMPISWSFLLKPALQEYLPAFLTNALGLNDDDADGIWYGAAARPRMPTPPKLLTTDLEILLVPHTTLQRVLKVCSDNHARLTALLDHLTSRALAAALQKRGQNYLTFGVEISINLRKCIPQGQNEIANYPSAIEQLHDVSTNPNPSAPLSSEDWKTIRHHTAELGRMSSTLSDQPIALLTYLSDFRQWILKKVSGPATGSFGMSNLGVFVDDRKSEQEWRVTQMLFSQSADGTSAVFNINVASVTDGPLAITLTWWPGMLGVDDEQRFAQDVLKAIESQLEAVL